MNPEIPKPEKIEDGTDLYDGMIFKFLEDGEYFNTLDAFTLNKLKERLEEYYAIMDDADYTKGEKLSRRLGVFINKYRLKESLEHVNLLLIKENTELDKMDNGIISFMSDYSMLEHVQYGDLIELRRRLALYCEILHNGSKKENERLSIKFGHYLENNSMMSMFKRVHMLIGVLEGE